SARRRWTAHPPVAVQHAVTAENAADGTNTGNVPGVLVDQCLADGQGAVLAQSRLLLQLATQCQDALLGPSRCAIGSRAWSAGAGTQIGPAQPLIAGAFDPALNGSQMNLESTCSRSEGRTPANGLHNPHPQQFPRGFLAMIDALETIKLNNPVTLR